MPKRKKLSAKTKLAAALLMLRHIPYEHAKLMTADQIISLYHFDHGVLHGIEPIDEPWNLTPRLIKPHREKSKRDTSTVAKVKRIEAVHDDFCRRVLGVKKRQKEHQKHKRRLQSRSTLPKRGARSFRNKFNGD